MQNYLHQKHTITLYGKNEDSEMDVNGGLRK